MKVLLLVVLLCAPAWAQEVESAWVSGPIAHYSADYYFRIAFGNAGAQGTYPSGPTRQLVACESMKPIAGGGWLWTPCDKPEIAVSNYHNPDARPVRDGLVEIAVKNAVFTDETVAALVRPQFDLGGVYVFIDNVPQLIRSAAPQSLVIIPDRRGGALSRLSVLTKTGRRIETAFFAVDTWPSIVMVGPSLGPEESREFIPVGYWGDPRVDLTPIRLDPIPVGPPEAPTIVGVIASGVRHAWPGGVEVRLNGIQCRVRDVHRFALIPGQDEVLFELPAEVAGRGSMDLVIQVGSRASNYARLVIGE